MMKKILLLMMIAALVFSCKTKQPLTSTRALETVDVGAAPNDGTGDPLRTAFQKINTAIGVMNDVSLDQATGATGTGNLVYSASPTLTGTVTLPTGTAASTSDINDTITARLSGGTVGVALADSNKYDGGYATPAWVDANAGGGNVTEQMLIFRVDDIGSPSAGDSIVIHNDFSGKVLDVYRDGDYQTPRFTNPTVRAGYRLNHDTITVNPVFQASEDWVIKIKGSVSRSYITFDQDLLDGLVAYYKFDETSGTALTDEIGGNTATLDGDISQTGIINQAVGLTANNDDIVIPYSEGVTLGESEQFSVSMWFYAEDLPSTVGRSLVLFQQNNSISPNAPHRASIGSSTNKIFFGVYTDAPSDIGVHSADAITADAWHHVVFVCPGAGGALQMWLDGVDVSTSAETVNGNLRDGDQYLCVGNSYNAATTAFYGKIDEFAIYNKVLTESEILKLYNSGSGNQYPFE